jgi:hypothetical protein
MSLTDVAIRKQKKPTKPVKMTDGKGLYLEVRPTGAKLWRYRYRLPDKNGVVREYLFAGGEYVQAPSGETKEQAAARIESSRLTLEEARAKRAEWRGLVKQGIHPVNQQRIRKAETIAAGANTFEAIAKRWIEKKGSQWTERNRLRIERTLEREVYPGIGNIPIKSVSAAHILAIMQRVEAEGAPTMAVLIRQWCYRIFNHAIANLLVGTNPAAGEIREAVQPPKTRNHPALTPNDIPVLMERLKGYKGERATVIALRLSRSRRKPVPPKSAPTAFENIEFLIENHGDITVGEVGSVRCAATAADEDQCLAMLQRRPGESLMELLQRLDAAIADAYENNVYIDEINPPPRS